MVDAVTPQEIEEKYPYLDEDHNSGLRGYRYRILEKCSECDGPYCRAYWIDGEEL